MVPAAGRYPVKHEGRRGDPELRSPADAAQPLDDEIDPEQEVAGPAALLGIPRPTSSRQGWQSCQDRRSKSASVRVMASEATRG
jgi:hypothetical protein